MTILGQETLCAAGEGESKLWYPSVWETVPAEARDLKKEIGKTLTFYLATIKTLMKCFQERLKTRCCQERGLLLP